MSLHIELASAIAARFSTHLAGPVGRTQDALTVRLTNGVTLTIRYAAHDAYSLQWTDNDVQAGIDTAPLHRELESFPNHLHTAAGTIQADLVTSPTREPSDNIARLIETLIDNPRWGFDGVAGITTST